MSFPNPLNINDLRIMDHCPPHFTKVTFDRRVSPDEIKNWVYENLSGRFFADTIELPNSKGLIESKFLVAFEDASEASYFSLFLPSINIIE